MSGYLTKGLRKDADRTAHIVFPDEAAAGWQVTATPARYPPHVGAPIVYTGLTQYDFLKLLAELKQTKEALQFYRTATWLLSTAFVIAGGSAAFWFYIAMKFLTAK